MNKRKIHIENLKIRLPRGTASHPGLFAGELGNEILQDLGEMTRGKTGRRHIDELSPGAIRISGGVERQGLQRHIARRVADEIGKRIE
jgi:hypothetical protein